MNTATLEYYTAGRLCVMLQRSPRAIEQAARALNMEPALIINSVRHWSMDQVDRLIEHFRSEGCEL